MTWAILKAEFRVLRRTVWPEVIGRSLAPVVFFILLPLIDFIPNRHGIQFAEQIDIVQNTIRTPVVATVLFGALMSPSLIAFKVKNSHYPLSLRGLSRPVTARFLVLVPLVWISALTILCYLFWTGVERFFLQTANPILPEIPFLLFATAVLAYVAWSRGHFFLRAGVLVSFVLFAFTWFEPEFFSATYGLDRVAPGKVTIWGTGSTDLAMLLGVIPLYWLTVDNIRRQRCGELPGSADRIPSYVERLERSPETLAPFSSAKSAEWWFEERLVMGKFGVALGGGLVFLLGGSWSLSAAGFNDLLELFLNVGAGYIAAGIALFGISSVPGVSVTKKGWQLSTFAMTQPRTVGDIVWQRFIVASLLTVISFAATFGCAYFCQRVFFAHPSGVYGYFHEEIFGEGVTATSILWAGVILAHVAITCVCVSLISMIAIYQSARPPHGYMVVPVFCLLAAVSKMILLFRQMGAELLGLDQLVMLSWGALLVGTTALGLRDAVRAGYFSIRQLVFVVAGWSMLLLLTAWLARDIALEWPAIENYATALLFGLLCVPIASIVWAPLSLAAARHQ